jgi:hypothetical protein
MSRLEHPISQEDLMAFVDGQLGTREASKIAQHVELCSDCAAAVAGSKDMSRQLAAWEIEPLPERAEKGVMEKLAVKGSAHRLSAWGWFSGNRGWVYGLGGAAGVMVLLMAVVVPSLLRSRQEADMAAAEMNYSLSQPQLIGEEFRREKVEQQGQQGRIPVGQPSPAIVPTAPMVIRTVRLTIVAKDFDAARASIDRIVQQSQGYIDQLTAQGDTGVGRRLSVTLRLPSNQIETGLAELKKIGRLMDETQSSSDVTSQYVDLDARLSNARNSEQRLLRLLSERAGSLKDVVEMEREISSVRENIERMVAQQKDLNNKVQFATVQIELAEEYRAQLAPPATSPGAQLRNAFVDGLKSAAESAFGIALFMVRYGPVFLVWLTVCAVVGFILWRLHAIRI